MSRQLVARVFVAVVVALVVGVVVLHPAPARPAPPTPGETRALFDELVRDEPAARERAREDWAHHRWSQQDGFGAMEMERVNALSAAKGRSKQDLLLVIDEGLRAKWPGPDGGVLDATIVPLKPRPMD